MSGSSEIACAPNELGDARWEREVALRVRDVSCRCCARRAASTLRTLDGVRGASLLRGRARVRFDVRRTSEREIAAAMGRAGFPVDRDRARMAGARSLGVGVAALAGLLALAAAGEASSGRPGGLVELALAAIALTACGAPIARRAFARWRCEGFDLDRDALALAGALAAFGVGLLSIMFTRHAAAPALLRGMGFDALAWRSARAWGFASAAGAVVASAIARFGAEALRARALRAIEAREAARSAIARRLDEGAAERPTPASELAPGDRVRVIEGERLPADLHLEGPARIARSDTRGPIASMERAPGDVAPEGAVLLSPAVIGRVIHGRFDLSAAMDAEVRRSLRRIDRDASRPPAWSWTEAATRALIASALGFGAFALVAHGLLGGGPANAGAIASAVAVLVGSSTAAFAIAAPAARAIAVLRARA